MYIWIGIDVDQPLSEVRRQAMAIDRELQFQNSCFTLPLHISLKMSFEIEDSLANDVISTIEAYYQSVSPFDVKIKGLEKDQVIVWIRMMENRRLNKLHDDLNQLLMEQFDVGLHEYDMDYKFHTTLFMDQDLDKIALAYQQIKHVSLPEVLRANRFVIGTSKSGALGTYSVIKEIIK